MRTIPFIETLFALMNNIKPGAQQFLQMACAPSDDSDQPKEPVRADFCLQ